MGGGTKVLPCLLGNGEMMAAGLGEWLPVLNGRRMNYDITFRPDGIVGAKGGFMARSFPLVNGAAPVFSQKFLSGTRSRT